MCPNSHCVKPRSHLPSPTVVNLQQAFKSHEDWVPVMPPSDGFTDISVDRHEYQVAGNIFSPLKSLIQCFGGYWNAMADNPAGWSTHLEASCNYIANTAVRHNFGVMLPSQC